MNYEDEKAFCKQAAATYAVAVEKWTSTTEGLAATKASLEKHCPESVDLISRVSELTEAHRDYLKILRQGEALFSAAVPPLSQEDLDLLTAQVHADVAAAAEIPPIAGLQDEVLAAFAKATRNYKARVAGMRNEVFVSVASELYADSYPTPPALGEQ